MSTSGKSVEMAPISGNGGIVKLWEERRDMYQQQLDNGGAVLFKTMNHSTVVFHQCIDPNTQKHRHCSINKVNFSYFEYPIDERHFDADIFEKVKEALTELGYRCTCDLKNKLIGQMVPVKELAPFKFGVIN
jgi:hypothetical protein